MCLQNNCDQQNFGHSSWSEENFDTHQLQQWKDEIMVWNPDEWRGIKAIGLSPDIIWTPDVILSNS